MRSRCAAGIFHRSAVFSSRICFLVHLTIRPPESDSHSESYRASGRETEKYRKPLDSISYGSGISPVLASTAYTEELLTAAGFLWYGDYNHIDLPFCAKNRNGTIVAFPHTDYADHRVLRGNPRDWYDVYKDTFDYLYQNEPAAFLNVTVHCHFGGRPLIAAMVDKIVKYFRGFPDVWMVRHDELAQWVRDNAIAEWTNQQRFFPDS